MSTIDLSAVASNAIAQAVEGGTLQAAIETGINKTLARLVDDATGPYTDFGKAMKAAVEGALKITASDIGLPSYNQFVLSIIKTKVDEILNAQLREKLTADLGELLCDAPAEMKVSDLVADFKKWVMEEKEGDGNYCYIGIERTSSYGSRWIRLDPKSSRSGYGARFAMLVSDDGKVFSVTDGSQDLKNTLFARGSRGFPRDIYRLMAAGTKLIFDEYEFDGSLAEYADEEF